MNPSVCLLSRISSQSKDDFMRWCAYHSTIGFRKIYIFSDIQPEWYEEAKKEIIEKYHDFSFIRVDVKWKRMSEMIRSFCQHCVNGDWGMVMSTDEWMFSSKKAEFDIRKLVSYVIQRNHAHAVTIYKEYVRKTDSGFMSKNYGTYSLNTGKFPVSSSVLFSVQDVNSNPLSGPAMPSERDLWIDTRWEKMTQNRLMSEMPEFSKCSVKIMKVVSDDDIKDAGAESEFNFNEIQFGTYFSGKFPDVFSTNPSSPVIEDVIKSDPSIKNENIPFTDDGAVIGKVLTGIMQEESLEGIINDMKSYPIHVSESDLKLIYEREARNVIRDNAPYRTLLEMLSKGSKQKDILKAIRVSPKTLKKMKGILETIPAEIKNEFSDEPEPASFNKEEEIGSSSKDEM